MSNNRRKVAYVTWDAPHAPYLEGLFLPIFSKIDELEFHVLQFSWADRERTEQLRQFCQNLGLTYKDIRVSRFGSVGPFLSAVRGGLLLRRKLSANGFDLIIARSTMPAIATLLAEPTIPFVFDADGLPLDERIENGTLRQKSLAARILFQSEAAAVVRANAVMVRTRAACSTLIGRTNGRVAAEKFVTVTNGRDADVFHPGTAESRAATRSKLGIGDGPLLVYSGSVTGTKYKLKQTVEFFEQYRTINPNARMLVLTPTPSMVPVSDGLITLSVLPGEVARYLAAADVGFAVIEPLFSMTAAAPIKTAEYLLCGLPVIGTPEVGDNQALIREGVFHPFDPNAVEWIECGVLRDRERMRDKARNAGIAQFSLEQSANMYRKAIELAVRNHGLR